MPKDSIPERLRRFVCYEAWNIGVVHQTVADITRRGIQGPVSWLPFPPGRTMLADPSCRVGEDGALTIYAEHLDYREFRGEIWSAHVPPGGDVTTARFEPLLSAPFHMSYPFPFEDDAGNRLLTAESWHAGNAYLWREANGSCEQVTALFPGRCVVDPTLLRTNDRWWLFCTFEDVDPQGCLFLFHTDELGNSWTPHPQNPIKTGMSGSRPAGPIFEVDGTLIRPGQDCSRTYGGGVVLHAIRQLTPDAYEEETVRVLEPLAGPYPHGLHTISSAGAVTLIDGKRWCFDPEGLVRRVQARVRQLGQGRHRAHAVPLSG
ncbi:MAG TPA: hypothetical protein VFL55_12920 [Acetobacteraceae bacterium]|nr:hypothetical protein [Acetobacteraceae bacterium]